MEKYTAFGGLRICIWAKRIVSQPYLSYEKAYAETTHVTTVTTEERRQALIECRAFGRLNTAPRRISWTHFL